MKVIFAPFPKGKVLKIAGWVILLILLVLALLMFKPSTSTITKEEVLKAVYNTQYAQNYRWHITSEIEFKGVHNILSDVDGEKNTKSYHLKGKFLKLPMEVVHIGNVTYRHDPLTREWLIIKNNDIASEEVLTTELNPVSALNFAAITVISPQGMESRNTAKGFRVSLQPELATQFLAKYWRDFSYVLWVDKDKKYLLGFELTAQSKSDKTGSVHMSVNFGDYNKKIEIKSPL